MTAHQTEHMFDLFYSTRKGGTGLGLAVVQRIASAHQAKLEVLSSPDRGTGIGYCCPWWLTRGRPLRQPPRPDRQVCPSMRVSKSS